MLQINDIYAKMKQYNQKNMTLRDILELYRNNQDVKLQANYLIYLLNQLQIENEE